MAGARVGVKGLSTNQWLVASGVLLASAIVVANDSARLEISPTYGDLLTDDIYESAESWRKPPKFESEWRAPKPKEKSRIKFGYDSAYEEMRARENTRSFDDQFDLREPKPSTLMRWKF